MGALNRTITTSLKAPDDKSARWLPTESIKEGLSMRALYRTLIVAAIAWAVALPGETAVAQTSIREHDLIGWAETEFYKDAEWERSSRASSTV